LLRLGQAGEQISSAFKGAPEPNHDPARGMPLWRGDVQQLL
jgi:hypothetical protein